MNKVKGIMYEGYCRLVCRVFIPNFSLLGTKAFPPTLSPQGLVAKRSTPDLPHNPYRHVYSKLHPLFHITLPKACISFKAEPRDLANFANSYPSP